MRIFIGDQDPVTGAPLPRVVVLFHGGTREEAAAMIEEGKRKVEGGESEGFDFGAWVDKAAKNVTEGAKSLWTDVTGAATRDHCNLCGGGHLPFQCPDRGKVKTTTDRKHAPGECLGSGQCRTCGSPAGHNCY